MDRFKLILSLLLIMQLVWSPVRRRVYLGLPPGFRICVCAIRINECKYQLSSCLSIWIGMGRIGIGTNVNLISCSTVHVKNVYLKQTLQSIVVWTVSRGAKLACHFDIVLIKLVSANRMNMASRDTYE